MHPKSYFLLSQKCHNNSMSRIVWYPHTGTTATTELIQLKIGTAPAAFDPRRLGLPEMLARVIYSDFEIFGLE